MFTTTPREHRRRGLAIVGVALTSALALPLVASPVEAASSVSAPASVTAPATTDRDQDRLSDRVRILCERVPFLLRRAQNLLDRIQGGEDVVGSLAWLDARIERARAAGRDDLVVVLTNRREIRAGLIPVLQRHIARLTQILERCKQLQDGR